MNNSEKISVIEQNNSNKIKIKGSQFIGYAIKISSVQEANEELTSLKKQFYDATHHCYAFKTNSGEEKFSDDGEPNGTAGIRIMNSIIHYGLTDIIVVVIRYYGGTKLGVGPLGKAYGETALSLLTNSKIINLIKFDQISIYYSYDDTSSIHYLLNKFNCTRIENIYENTPKIKCFIKPDDIIYFHKELTEKTSGKAQLKLLNEHIYLRLKQK